MITWSFARICLGAHEKYTEVILNHWFFLQEDVEKGGEGISRQEDGGPLGPGQ